MDANTRIGKRVVDDLYVHLAAVEQRFDQPQRAAIERLLASIGPREFEPNVVKVNLRDGRMSLLSYPDFQEAGFPQLAASWTQASNGELRYRVYTESINPPILHRKELLVAEDWPERKDWEAETRLAESLGLFDDPQRIGLRGNWERMVAAKGYRVVGSKLVAIGNDEFAAPLDADDYAANPPGIVQRHLTALSRSSLSAPMQFLIRSGMLTSDVSMFDYGCGKGDDVRGLLVEGYAASGWDPYYAPEGPRVEADLVNLGFVINVIEDAIERADALRAAASLARRLLVVSVMLHNSAHGGRAFGDGVLSTRNTFQKYYSQEEFRDYLEHALMLPVIMAAPGIAMIFKDRDLEQRFLIGRFRRKDVASRLLVSIHRVPRLSKPPKMRAQREPRQSAAQIRREELKPVISELWQLALDLGRWPCAEEVASLKHVEEKAGSLGRALRLVRGTCDPALLLAASKARQDDVLLFLAMQQFSKRPAYKRLDERLQRDVKCFFGTYGAAYTTAARLLLDTGDSQKLLDACRDAASRGLGYLEGDRSLQLHISLLDRLPVILRTYVACGLVLWDETSSVQLVKVHIGTRKLTLLEFEEFDEQWLLRIPVIVTGNSGLNVTSDSGPS